MALLIKGGRVLHGKKYALEKLDVVVEGTRIKTIASGGSQKGTFETVIDATGCVVVPGLFDIHVHLREPGREDAETIATGTRAAVKGGVVALSSMPNTKPVIDNGGMVEFILSQVEEVGLCNVHPFGAITKGLLGEEMAEIGELAEAGCVGITDDGRPVMNSVILRRSLEYAKHFNILVMEHCEDINLSEGGVMNEGATSTRLGLKGIPSASEAILVARDIHLARLAGTGIHIAHVSCAESVELIRQARREGLDVTAHTCPHYFSLTEENCADFDTRFKINPPLRTRRDVEAVIAGLKDGTIQAIASDHAPHPGYEKEKDFNNAPFGTIGLETLFSVSYTYLVEKGHLSLGELIKLLSFNPAQLVKLDYGVLEEGGSAHIAVIDLNAEYSLSPEDIVSKSKNSVFLGVPLKGAVRATIVDGKVVYSAF
ncbi:MAG: dihydroorotase [Candidatus Omnitrophica bacterium]|nr:dihydroorotase [Candidatus Omnitrophota bacterium]